MNIINPHIMETAQVLSELRTDAQNGLSGREAADRLQKYGANRLPAQDGVSPWKILLKQFQSIIVVLLLAAGAISLVLGDYPEAAAILAVLLLNALFGFVTEYRAGRAMEALRNMVVASAKVIRDGKTVELNADEVVPGDILVLEEGDSVTADGRLVIADNLAVEEAALTGESQPVDKVTEPLRQTELPLGDRKNMVYMGTLVVRGNGRFVVTATGSGTEMGNVSRLLEQTGDEDTPLEKRLAVLGRSLVFISLGIAAVIAAVGIAMGRPVLEILETSIALAIAAVPEGLPAVSTITLAIGMRRMARQNAIIRRLPAVETLGSVTVICTDKTGTLTENQMTVEEIWLGGLSVKVTGTGYKPEGEFFNGHSREAVQGDLELFLKAGALASNAAVNQDDSGRWDVVGDPTEGALVTAALKGDFNPETSRRQGYQELREIPFSSAEKRMAVYYLMPDGEKLVLAKGAPKIILAACTRMQQNGRPVALDEQGRLNVIAANDRLARRGFRVLAVACRPVESETEEAYQDLILLGLAGIADPPRGEAGQAIAEAGGAGIRSIMITGDQSETALAIGKRLGLGSENAVSGTKLQTMSRDQLKDELARTSIFARVNPRDKLDIVDILQEQGEIVAMTGDGVNDAPALKKANIGVAMGREGTMVAREAADMVLTDDNFATIIRAVKEGRVIFDNITKFIQYLFSCNLSEILVIFIALLLGVPLPLVALQILWLNLVTDVFPALSLGWEPGDRDIMKRPPRDPNQAILTTRFQLRILIQGVVLSVGTLAAYLYALKTTGDVDTSRTVAFVTLAGVQLLHVFNIRSGGILRPDRTLFNNPVLWGAIVLVLLLQLLAVYQPLLNRVLHTVPLDAANVLTATVASLATLAVLQALNRLSRLSTTSN